MLKGTLICSAFAKYSPSRYHATSYLGRLKLMDHISQNLHGTSEAQYLNRKSDTTLFNNNQALDRKLLATRNATNGIGVCRCYCSEITPSQYEKISEEFMQYLCDTFEEFGDSGAASRDYDVTYSSGVLTIKLGSKGTYVINKQSPNKQIWLSSPVSGPKRYDYVNGEWIYKHDGMPLTSLLRSELPQVFVDV